MANKKIWISYDLGVKGDYPGLYKWLDNHDAVETGNSVAFLNFHYIKDFYAELKSDLRKHINFTFGERIYVIASKGTGKDKKSIGRFIIGKRKSTPWEGYGDKGADITDIDE